MAQLGFNSAILRLNSSIDQFGINAARTAPQTASDPLTSLFRNLDSARTTYDSLLADLGGETADVTGAVNRLSLLDSTLDDALKLEIKHAAAGHVSTAKTAALRVSEALQQAQRSGTDPDVRIGSEFFQHFWQLRHRLDEALTGANTAKALGGWR